MNSINIVAIANIHSEDHSVHSDTFIRAIRMGVEWIKEQGINISLFWFNDNANSNSAFEAAQAIMNLTADLVIGHYASGAALAAAPTYKKCNIPLFLPASSASNLNGLAFRLCDSDDDYLDWLIDEINIRELWPISILHDSSVHGKSIYNGLKERLSNSKISDSIAKSKTILYSGMYANSTSFIKNCISRKERKTIILTDDAQTEKIMEIPGVSKLSIYIAGFSITPNTELAKSVRFKYKKLYGEYPGIYFFETFAALQVAITPIKHGMLNNSIPTILGSVYFDAKGESRPKRFQLFSIDGSNLCPVKN